MISVIIPTYKNPDMLHLCLQSAVEGQKNQNQIIVVVDGHYDVNEHVLNKWCHTIEILNLETNVGLCKGTNLGVMNATNEIIFVVNDDNVFSKDFDLEIESQLKERNVLTLNQIEPEGPGIFNFPVKDFGRNPSEFKYEEFIEYEQSIRKNELTTQIALLTQAKLNGKDVTAELALTEAELAEAEFELANDSDALRLARERLDLAESNLTKSTDFQTAAQQRSRDMLYETIDATDELTNSTKKLIDQQALLQQFRAIETAPISRQFPTPPQIAAPVVSDQATVSAPISGQAQQEVSVKVELSDNAEDFLQVTQERLAKKGYAIR